KAAAEGAWQFTAETVQKVESMFRALLGKPPAEAGQEGTPALGGPRFWEAPGVWLRLRLPQWLQLRAGPLDLYQWPGLPLAGLASWLAAWGPLAVVCRVAAWLLRRSNSALSADFVCRALRPLRCLAAAWTFFLLLEWLDLPTAVAEPLFAAEKFLMAALLGWLGLRLIDLSTAFYMNT